VSASVGYYHAQVAAQSGAASLSQQYAVDSAAEPPSVKGKDIVTYNTVA